MKQSLWIDPSFGASGDMFLGALAGLVESTDALVSGLASLDLDGYSISSETVTRNGISANRVSVETTATKHGRRWSDIDQLIAGSDLPSEVRSRARATFRRLGEVEAEQHQVDLDAVHFHEVGAVDAIVDIVGSWILVNELGIDSVTVGPVGLGHGTVKAAHGTLPLPAPATAALLVGIPVVGLDTSSETCTPTGAVLLREMANGTGPIPSGTITKISRGAGGRDPSSHPNVVTMFLLDVAEPADSSQRVATLLTSNIDDVTPEVMAHTINCLLDAGADDAWIVPIIMKKGRPAFELRVLCSPDIAARLRLVMFKETGTLGIREETIIKHALSREFTTVVVRGQTISMKTGPFGTKPEFDDLLEASKATGVPVRILAIEAQTAALGLEP